MKPNTTVIAGALAAVFLAGPVLAQTNKLQQVAVRPAAAPSQTPARPPAAPPKTAAAPAAAPAPQTGPGGFKVGDTVKALTGNGWIDDIKIVGIRGNSYQVRIGAYDISKGYPSEIRRMGALTVEDHQFGQYDLHDRVQVLFENNWVDSEVIGMQQLGLVPEYQVTLPANRTAWANPDQLKFVGPPLKPVAAKGGTPPKPGLTSCAGKFEGRYSPSGGGFGGFLTIVFQAGKATISDPGGGKDEFECWTGGGKIYLHKPGEPNDFELDINNDGTLDTPFGEIKKKS